MSSPGWVQVKCDLRVLSQFPFNLNPEWELPANKRVVNRQPLKEGVRDMLVKHHLFSWDESEKNFKDSASNEAQTIRIT